MKNYEIINHTADLKIKGFGKTKKKLFLNLLKAMIECQKAKMKEEEKPKVRKIRIKSLNLETLLVDFLNEIIYLSQINKEIYPEANFKKFSTKEIEAELVGRPVERFGEDIKAVTYHGLKIEKIEENIFQATVLFDI